MTRKEIERLKQDPERFWRIEDLKYKWGGGFFFFCFFLIIILIVVFKAIHKCPCP